MPAQTAREPPFPPLMASSFILLLLSLAAASSSAALQPETDQACGATRFPDTCRTTLSSASLPTPSHTLDLISAATAASRHNLQTARSMVQSILRTSGSDVNRTTAAKNCLEVLYYSDLRIALASSPECLAAGRYKDARAWLSAALLYQYDCFSALKYVNTTNSVNATMAFLLGLSQQTSNALAMVAAYERFGSDTVAWRPPQTERDGYWEGGSAAGTGSGYGGGRFPAAAEADVTVCKEGCDYTAVQEAVDSAPANLSGGRRFVVYIKEGVYEATVRVPLDKTNLIFLGDGMGKTVITGSLNVGQMVGVSTYNTATVGVAGDGFMARDITFENTAGPDAHQAVAFRSTADLSVLDRCEFLGHQDTLYAHSLRQLYSSCRIAGTIDFIFGNSATVFESCLVLIRPRQLNPEEGETNTVTAHGRTDPGQSTGFVFRNCTINGMNDYLALYRAKPNVHKTYLGRPWKEYSRTVFLGSYLGEIIQREGWMPWDGEFALPTLYYGEYQSTGPGANMTARVAWSSQIPAEHVGSYSVQSFIQGNECVMTRRSVRTAQLKVRTGIEFAAVATRFTEGYSRSIQAQDRLPFPLVTSSVVAFSPLFLS